MFPWNTACSLILFLFLNQKLYIYLHWQREFLIVCGVLLQPQRWLLRYFLFQLKNIFVTKWFSTSSLCYYYTELTDILTIFGYNIVFEFKTCSWTYCKKSFQQKLNFIKFCWIYAKSFLNEYVLREELKCFSIILNDWTYANTFNSSNDDLLTVLVKKSNKIKIIPAIKQ